MEKDNFAILALVAIVAVIGVISLVLVGNVVPSQTNILDSNTLAGNAFTLSHASPSASLSSDNWCGEGGTPDEYGGCTWDLVAKPSTDPER